MCKANEPYFNHCLLGTIYIATIRDMLASVPLTAITEAIQEIKMLHKHRHTNQTVVQG